MPFPSGMRQNRIAILLVAAIQGVIRPSDKDFAPLNETGRKKRGDHTDKNLLDKRRLHTALSSRGSAIASPKASSSDFARRNSGPPENDRTVSRASAWVHDLRSFGGHEEHESGTASRHSDQ
jgi:hypothetical protein